MVGDLRISGGDHIFFWEISSRSFTPKGGEKDQGIPPEKLALKHSGLEIGFGTFCRDFFGGGIKYRQITGGLVDVSLFLLLSFLDISQLKRHI